MASPEPGASSGAPRLVLEYVKTLVWPVTILVLLVLYRSDIAHLVKRTESLSVAGAAVKFGTGAGGSEAEGKGGVAPEMWFSLTKADVPLVDCLSRARNALEATKFSRIATNQGTTIYRYDDSDVGVIWCADAHRLALVAVSGPGSRSVAEKQARLLGAFEAR